MRALIRAKEDNVAFFLSGVLFPRSQILQMQTWSDKTHITQLLAIWRLIHTARLWPQTYRCALHTDGRMPATLWLHLGCGYTVQTFAVASYRLIWDTTGCSAATYFKSLALGSVSVKFCFAYNSCWHNWG